MAHVFHLNNTSIMTRIFVFLLLTCCFSKTYSQTENNKFSFSVRYLGAGDITVQSPVGGKSFRNGTISIIPGIDANFEMPVKSNFWLSTGYRWKEFWGTTTNIGSYLGDSHALYAKLVWRKSFFEKLLPGRLSFDIGAGVMGSRIVDNGGGSSSFTITTFGTGAGTYSGFETWNSAYKTPNFSASLDGLASLHCRLYKKLYFSAGYGFNYGLKDLKRGSYTLAGPAGFSISGTMATKGSYVYLLTGLKLQF